MNKQYFVALCLLVTVSTISGMEKPKPGTGMGFSNSFWEDLLKYSSTQWTIIKHADQETKNEVLKQLFTPKFKKLFSEPISWRCSISERYPKDNRWEAVFKLAQDVGANLKSIKIDLWEIPNPELVQHLIQQGAPTDLCDQSTGETLLHKAVEDPYKNLGLVALYLNHIHEATQDNQDNTPLHTLCAAWGNQNKQHSAHFLEKVDLLIKAPRGKSILIKNRKGYTPLERAYITMINYLRHKKYSRKYYKIYKELKNKMKARVQEESYAQETGYEEREIQGQYTACEERIEQFKKQLKENLKKVKDKSWLAMEYADQETKDDRLQKLFNSGFKRFDSETWEVRFNLALEVGANPAAVKINLWGIEKPELVQRLIQQGAPTDLREPETRRTLLHKAVEDHSTELVALYVNHIDDTEQDNQGNTPLHVLLSDPWFSKYPDYLSPKLLDKADHLIKTPRGKSILMPNHNGVTPLELAYIEILKHRREKHPRDDYIICELLKNKMKARLKEESYAQETEYEESDFQRQHNACKERIKKLKEPKCNNFVQSTINFFSRANTYEKVD